ncbi:MAG: hypothetical protein IRZ31_15485 [Thermogemmatispora sp.]|uniref:hypothetical protein n=1 Tax=Thermogemmatispora sp. TaxID=1968838 RepID=UPI002631C773|nr:hypothetical protein [Thermogemmatispora sp.]MBX5458295.1 hypothetical protein [Thermogemmatispora sp.]
MHPSQSPDQSRPRRSLFDPIWQQQSAQNAADSSAANAATNASPQHGLGEEAAAGNALPGGGESAAGPGTLGSRPVRKLGLLSAARLQAETNMPTGPAAGEMQVTQMPFPGEGQLLQTPMPVANMGSPSPFASATFSSPSAGAGTMADASAEASTMALNQSALFQNRQITDASTFGEGPQAPLAQQGVSQRTSAAGTDATEVQLPFPAPAPTSFTGFSPNVTRVLAPFTGPLPGTTGTLPRTTTGALGPSPFVEAGGSKNTAALTGALRLVQIPVAGQPGRYVTSMLPVLTEPMQPPPAQGDSAQRGFSPASLWREKRNLLILLCVLLVVLTGSGLLMFARLHANPAPQARKGSVTAAVATGTAAVKGTPTPTVIMEDPLEQNIHNWPVATTGSRLFVFKNGAYHIINNDDNNMAVAILPDAPGPLLSTSLAYTLTMQEIKGDDGSINNQFGMIVRYSQQSKGGKVTTQFYAFEVRNTSDGEYQFWKFNSSAPEDSRWTKIWSKSFGKEYHQGHGSKATNTIKIVASGKNFTFYVNGKKVGTAQDGSIPSGSLGLLVNLKGTEVAFSNLLVTTP